MPSRGSLSITLISTGFAILAERYAETKHLSPQDKLYLDETERRNAIFKELKIDWWQPL
jgi:hypothetical protein